MRSSENASRSRPDTSSCAIAVAMVWRRPAAFEVMPRTWRCHIASSPTAITAIAMISSMSEDPRGEGRGGRRIARSLERRGLHEARGKADEDGAAVLGPGPGLPGSDHEGEAGRDRRVRRDDGPDLAVGAEPDPEAAAPARARLEDRCVERGDGREGGGRVPGGGEVEPGVPREVPRAAVRDVLRG